MWYVLFQEMDLEGFHCNNHKDFVIKSTLPEDVIDQEIIIGIDEAGIG